MVTPSFSLAATEQVSPKLALDFTSASLDPRITFARTTGASNPATYVNSSGVITSASNDQPRFDYDPIALTCKGLLIEESRTNTFLQSQDPSVSPWNTTFNISFPGGTTTSPSGGAAKFVAETAANGGHLVFQAISVTTGVAYSMSVFLKPNGRTKGQFGNSSISKLAVFDLALGQITSTSSGVTATIAAYPSGWYKLTMTYTASTTASQGHSVYFMNDAGSTSYAGDITKGYYVWGAQLEVGAFATSYIPTTTTALTRNADVATMTGTNFSDWYNASQGTVRVDADTPASGTRPLVSFDDNTASNKLVLVTSNTAPTFNVAQGGSSQASVAAGTITANASMFAYISYATNYFGIARPSARQIDTSGTVPTVDRLRIGADQSGNYMNGHVQSISFWS